MAGTADIKNRINSVADTKKVTDAMYMIASVKMKRARREVENAKPYFTELTREIAELIRYIPEGNNKYLKIRTPEGETPRYGVLAVTSDKGLSGGYNKAVMERVEHRLKLYPDMKVFIVGDYGKRYFRDNGLSYVEDFSYPSVLPDITEASAIATELLEYYDMELLDRIDFIYTDFRSGRPNECVRFCLLPLEKSHFDIKEPLEDGTDMDFYPDPETLLNGIVPNYLTGFIYVNLVESYCSEQEARMTMMSTAGKNAEEMLSTLRLQYNSVRQAAITREMTEIASGARALREKRTAERKSDYR